MQRVMTLLSPIITKLVMKYCIVRDVINASDKKLNLFEAILTMHFPLDLIY